jgi:hypothetical protein
MMVFTAASAGMTATNVLSAIAETVATAAKRPFAWNMQFLP